MAATEVADDLYVGVGSGTSDGVTVTPDAATSQIVVHAGWDGSVGSPACELRTAAGGGGSLLGTFDEPAAFMGLATTGAFGLAGGGGYHCDFIIDAKSLGLTPGVTYYCWVTHTTSRTATLQSVRIQGTKVTGSGPGGSVDYDREGTAGNGQPADLTLTAVAGGRIYSHLVQRDVGATRVTTPTDDIAGASALYTDTTSNLGVSLRVSYPATTAGTTAVSGYTILSGGTPDNTGYVHSVFTFEEDSGGGSPTDYPVSADDGIAFGDTATPQKNTLAAAADGIAFGDVATPQKDTLVTVDDGIAFGDVAAPSIAYQVSADDGIAFGDTATPTKNTLASAADGIKFGDTVVTVSRELHVSATDGIKFGDVATVSIQYKVSASDGIKFGDLASAGATASASDGIKFGDVASALKRTLATALDGIKFGDTALPSVLYHVSAADGIKFGDIAAPSVTYHISVSDGIKFSDTAEVTEAAIAFTITLSVVHPIAITGAVINYPISVTGAIIKSAEA